MFFRRWRVARRGRHGGASLRALHESLGEPLLSPKRLLAEAEDAALQDYFAVAFQDRRQDPDFILAFVLAYLKTEVQIRLPRGETKDATLEELLAFSSPGRENEEYRRG